VFATKFEDCDYVYASTREGVAAIKEKDVIVDFFGVAVSGTELQDDNRVHVYVKVDQELTTQTSECHAIMSRHFNGLYQSVFYNDPMDPKALFRPRNVKRGGVDPIANASIFKVSKVTAAHHSHFKMEQVIASLTDEMRSRVSQHLRVPHDASVAMACGMILWFSSLTVPIMIQVIHSGLVACATVKEFMLTAKSISVEAKSLQNIIEMDLRSVFECDVLVNRGIGQVDWNEEKAHRVKPNLAHVPDDVIYTRACQVFHDAAQSGRKPTRRDWTSYWADRWQWSAAGSVHTQHAEDEQYVFKSDRRLKNKFISLIAMPDVEPGYFLNRTPQLYGWTSTKYEWGKMRAIYGTDVTSYVIAHHAFYNCEEVLPSYFPVGPDATNVNVAARVAAILQKRQPYCLDFEDFNSQHSISAMQKVIQAYRDVFSNNLTDTQLAALEWTSQSLEDMFITDNSGGTGTYKARATLLSGWRLTTFMNSVLNFIYTVEVCQETRQKGLSLHNGDDVIIGSRNMVVTQRSLQRAKKLNIRVQPSKCAYAGIAEFLRIDHRRGSRGQYLARAVATVVHSRIESLMSTDVRDLMASMEGRFADLRDRGMPNTLISSLRDQYYNKQMKICGVSVSDMYHMKVTHAVCGGISQSNDASTDLIVQSQRRHQDDVELPELPGIHAFAARIKKVLAIETKIKVVTKRLRDATFEAVCEKDRAVKLIRTTDPWYSNVKRIYKAHKGPMSVAGFGKAALVGLSLDLIKAEGKSAALTEILNASQRPMQLLQMLI
jgi:hypothetical protein